MGQRLGVTDRADPAGLPFAIAVLTAYLFLVTPLMNRFEYVLESDADLFGLNAAREPYGFATVSMRVGAYRKLNPSRLEELLLFDHPSGRRRVEMAMRGSRKIRPCLRRSRRERNLRLTPPCALGSAGQLYQGRARVPPRAR